MYIVQHFVIRHRSIVYIGSIIQLWFKYSLETASLVQHTRIMKIDSVRGCSQLLLRSSANYVEVHAKPPGSYVL